MASAARRIALVHDSLNQRGGAERLFATIAHIAPHAPIYTAFYDADVAGDIVAGHTVRASVLNRLPGARRAFRYLAPLYPAVFESFDLDAFDVIVSSTTSWAKGVVVRGDAVHVSYVHAVSRFVTDYDAYVGPLVGEGAKGKIARAVVERIARWDNRAAQRPTVLVANSHKVARDIARFYGRTAEVLHPAVDTANFDVGSGEGGYVLATARMLPYKRLDLAIAGCARAGMALRVIGDGPMRDKLEATARGTTTQFLGSVSDDERRALFAGARAVVVAGEEDFGLVAIEAAAAGRPVVAYGRGGALETVVPGVTGVLFDEPDAASLALALARLETLTFDPARLRAHAERFGPDRFLAGLRAIVDRACRSGR